MLAILRTSTYFLRFNNTKKKPIFIAIANAIQVQTERQKYNSKLIRNAESKSMLYNHEVFIEHDIKLD